MADSADAVLSAEGTTAAAPSGRVTCPLATARAIHGVRFRDEKERRSGGRSSCAFRLHVRTPDETATTRAVKLAPALEAFAADTSAHGAPAVVFHVRNGDQQELRATGVNNLESNKKAAPTDKTWIIGAGTPMVAVSVMKLVQGGTVRLDDPVSAHLPEFTAIFPASDRVTVRDLLGSTSGLPDYFPPLIESRSPDELQTRPLTFEERLRIAAGVDLPPGPVSYFAWSATDWEVLGWLLERKYNRGLEEVLAKDVF